MREIRNEEKRMEREVNGNGKRCLFVAVILLFCGGLVQANYIDIYQDTIIDSDLNAIVTVHGSAQITVLPGGGATVFHLTDTSSAFIHGGHASYDANDSSILNLYGGTFGSVKYISNSAKIYVHGQNFQLPANPYYHSVFLQGEWLNGTEFDIYFRGLPVPFENALGTNVFLVPEPCTISLVGFGIFLLNRKTKTLDS